jgi:hypothetical protein
MTVGGRVRDCPLVACSALRTFQDRTERKVHMPVHNTLVADDAVRHEMTAPSAAEILRTLPAVGAAVTVGGGWAIDALMGKQSRRHEDLDLWLPAADLECLIKAFVASGLDRLYPWGDDRPWSVVVHDGGRLRARTPRAVPIANETASPDAVGRLVRGDYGRRWL